MCQEFKTLHELLLQSKETVLLNLLKRMWLFTLKVKIKTKQKQASANFNHNQDSKQAMCTQRADLRVLPLHCCFCKAQLSATFTLFMKSELQ